LRPLHKGKRGCGFTRDLTPLAVSRAFAGPDCRQVLTMIV